MEDSHLRHRFGWYPPFLEPLVAFYSHCFRKSWEDTSSSKVNKLSVEQNEPQKNKASSTRYVYVLMFSVCSMSWPVCIQTSAKSGWVRKLFCSRGKTHICSHKACSHPTPTPRFSHGKSPGPILLLLDIYIYSIVMYSSPLCSVHLQVSDFLEMTGPPAAHAATGTCKPGRPDGRPVSSSSCMAQVTIVV